MKSILPIKERELDWIFYPFLQKLHHIFSKNPATIEPLFFGECLGQVELE
jgi:hypothetical protein